jgi:hypothetical protein
MNFLVTPFFEILKVCVKTNAVFTWRWIQHIVTICFKGHLLLRDQFSSFPSIIRTSTRYLALRPRAPGVRSFVVAFGVVLL